MAEIIMTADVAEAARAHLEQHLPGVQVTAGTTPETFDEQSVSIIRTGGYPRDLVTDLATIAVDCRHLTSETGADLLARRVDALIRAAAEDGYLGELVCHDVATFSGPYDNPDPTHPSLYRVSASYQVAVRMTTTT